MFDKLSTILLVESECIELGQLLFSCFSWNGLHKINCEDINFFQAPADNILPTIQYNGCLLSLPRTLFCKDFHKLYGKT